MSDGVATLRIYESELRQIAEAVGASPDLETGGELLGLWSHGDSPTVLLSGVTVMLAGTPAPDSRRAVTWFEQSGHTHMELERLVWEQHGVQVVGLWHSHHQLSLHDLSGGDVARTIGYSRRHQRPRYSEILAYLVPPEGGADGFHDRRREFDVELRPYVYADATTGRALPTRVEELPGMSPLRSALRKAAVSSDLRQVIDGSTRWSRQKQRYHCVENTPGRSASPAIGHEPSAAHDVRVTDPGSAAHEPIGTVPGDVVPDSGGATDADRPWGLVALEAALPHVVPPDAMPRMRVEAAHDRVVLEVLSLDNRARLTVCIAGSSMAKGTVTGHIDGPSGTEVYAPAQKTRKVELAGVLADGLGRLGYGREC